MVDSNQISTSKTIQQRTGRTFHLATRLLPERVRHPTYVLYAFFRVADDVVDTPANRDPDVQRTELEAIRAAALGERDTDDAVLSAFRELVVRYDIAEADVDAFVDAMLADLDTARYDTHEELAAYMRGSSVAVGNMMMDVMEVENPEIAAPHAAALAEAFQLSNFLRDVKEDVDEYDRVYLPGETRREYGVTVEQLRRGEVTEGFRAAMCSELAYTEERYREGVAGIEYLPDDCQFAVLLAAVLYADHHREIRARNCDVLSATPTLGTTRKLWLLAKTRALWALHEDPKRMFYRVTGLSASPSTHGNPPANVHPAR
ncbi:phytoene/squalene synthase family protein [Halobacterium zhouii]|uniref:phytoene/squalene synthase family protein n=1 Tax=Halobacterium zhouii TaxID=2902624 RepID=UPI001E502DBE|nr:phytoene/squalene synthase family protein [Halobacterium zhouii]